MPKLTPASVEKHKPNKHQRREIPDAASPGLYLIIRPAAAKALPCGSATPMADR